MNTYQVAETKTIQVGGRDYLFLVADKAIFEMDRSTKATLVDLGRRDALTREEIHGAAVF